ncbi:LemA family protein [bacterium]|nr:LemA family protein [bacterium]
MKNTKCLSVSFFLAVLALSGCGYNSLQGLDEDVKATWSEVENQYQRRLDLVPNLVASVKGYAKHEKETLEAVIQARASATQTKVNASDLSNPEALQKYQRAQDGLSSALSRLLIVAEQYPQLKANENFRDLNAQLEGTENRITVARKRYIEQVAEYNKAVRYFPTNITAKFLLKLEPRATFTAAPGAETAPKVEF